MDNNPSETIYNELESELSPEARQEVTPDMEEKIVAEAAEEVVEADASQEAPAEEEAVETTAPVQEAPKQPEAPKGPSLLDLSSNLTSQFNQQEQQPFSLPNQQPQIAPGQEITPEQYDQHVTQKAVSIVDLKIRAFQNANRQKSEIHDALQEYAQLNPKKETTGEYDEDLSLSVTEAAAAFMNASPTGNVKAFIDKMMQPYQKAVQREVGKQKQAVAKQATQTAIRPTQVASTKKAFSDLSIDEMEKELGLVY